ncbi:hypothetical protein [Candidatus Manganitrophus noduliformans]|uniref:Uncharacterized protein n=1 Tax=Candidatus Manganitrophus noduliformans TaxID=2606439 RepID=A0A7X6DMH1_9BACT|nr:hypothetical protein [Candidatus Manganitrophus noduliformans]NKE69869.1 hypothetical protein [Candidatus Manganitrophus noduliformans]
MVTQSHKTPEMIRNGVFDCQVCVPKNWSNKKITEFAERESPCGTKAGWTIRTDKRLLAGDPVRAQCNDKDDFIHVTLDA